jgi:uncharacterized protein DUF6429
MREWPTWMTTRLTGTRLTRWLALMYLTTFEEHGVFRTWKGYDWGVLNRLHKRGWITDPVSKAKSVSLSDEAQRLSRDMFERHFRRAPT